MPKAKSYGGGKTIGFCQNQIGGWVSGQLLAHQQKNEKGHKKHKMTTAIMIMLFMLVCVVQEAQQIKTNVVFYEFGCAALDEIELYQNLLREVI